MSDQFKCCMCTEVMSDMGSVLAHMTKYHNLNFADKEDMNRRLQAIGFDAIENQAQQRMIRPLYG